MFSRLSKEDKEELDKLRASITEGFEKSFLEWKNLPMTRMMISLVPPTTEHPELLETILKDCFLNGCKVGESAAAMAVLQTFTKKDR